MRNIFTINGDKYIAYNENIFKIGATVTEILELEENQFYLHDEKIGRFELQDNNVIEAYDVIFRPIEYTTAQYYSKEGRGTNEEFTEAQVLERQTPDHIENCPNCGGWAGDDEEDKTCYTCGYGTPGGIYEDRDNIIDDELV